MSDGVIDNFDLVFLPCLPLDHVQRRLRRRAHAGPEPELLVAVADAGAEALHAGEQGENRGLL